VFTFLGAEFGQEAGAGAGAGAGESGGAGAGAGAGGDQQVLICSIAYDLKRSPRAQVLVSHDAYALEKSLFELFGLPLLSEEDWAVRSAATDLDQNPLYGVREYASVRQMVMDAAAASGSSSSSSQSPFGLQVYPKFSTVQLAGYAGKLSPYHSSRGGLLRFKSYSEVLEFLVNQKEGNALKNALERVSILPRNSPLLADLLRREKIPPGHDIYDFLNSWLPALRQLALVASAERFEITCSGGQGKWALDFALLHNPGLRFFDSEQVSQLAWIVLDRAVHFFLEAQQAQPSAGGAALRETWARSFMAREIIQLALNGDLQRSLLSSMASSLRRTLHRRILQQGFLVQSFQWPQLRQTDLDLRKLAFSLSPKRARQVEDLLRLYLSIVNGDHADAAVRALDLFLNRLNAYLRRTGKPPLSSLTRAEVEPTLLTTAAPARYSRITLEDWVRRNFLQGDPAYPHQRLLPVPSVQLLFRRRSEGGDGTCSTSRKGIAPLILPTVKAAGPSLQPPVIHPSRYFFFFFFFFFVFLIECQPPCLQRSRKTRFEEKHASFSIGPKDGLGGKRHLH